MIENNIKVIFKKLFKNIKKKQVKNTPNSYKISENSFKKQSSKTVFETTSQIKPKMLRTIT